MLTDIRQHPSHYLALVIILLPFTLALLLFNNQQPLRELLLYALVALYLLWGVIHHYLLGHLRLKVVLEYLLIALLGALIIKNLW